MKVEQSIKAINLEYAKVMETEAPTLIVTAGTVNFKLPPAVYASILEFILFILEFIRDEGTNEDGSPKKLKLWDFVVNSNLRNFVLKLISFAIELVAGIFANKAK